MGRRPPRSPRLLRPAAPAPPSGRRTTGRTGVALLALGAMAATASARDADPEGALALAAEGRCAAAVPRLEAAAEGPAADDPRLHRALGLCRLRAGRHAEATAALERARALDPDDAEAPLHLAAARYHLGDREGARAALAAVPPAARDRAEWWLYEGLLALDAAEPDRAFEALQRARHLEPAVVEPVASFYAGAAASATARRDAARRAFARVLRDWPDSPFAEEARRALRSLEPPRRRFARLQTGVEYDDNVVLRGDGVALPDEIGNEGDLRGVWSLELAGDLARGPDRVVGAALRYAGSAHRDLDAFDVHYPSVAAWLDQELAPATLLRARLEAGYAWVDAEPFLADQRLGLALHRTAGRLAGAQLFAELYREDVFFEVEDVPDGPGRPGAPCPDPTATICGPRGLDESRARDRDGLGLRLGFGRETRMPGLTDGSLHAGYRFHAFRAEGREYTFDAHELLTGARIPLPCSWTAELDVFLAWRSYRHPTTFPDPDGLVAGRSYALDESDRRERELGTTLAVERPLGDAVRVGAAWRYTRNHSTADVFDYDRHVVGAYLTVGFGG